MKKKHMTTAEVAAVLGVSSMSIVRWCDDGKGPEHHRTPGGQRRFEPAAVAAWMKGRGMTVPESLLTGYDATSTAPR